MTVPTGPASLGNIQNEFGGSNPISLSEYYAGGAYVSDPAPTSGQQTGIIPTAGAISIGNFLGVSNYFTFDYTIASDTNNFNVRTAAINAGWDTVVPLVATITVNAAAVVSSTSTATPAFKTGTSFPAGSSISLINFGHIDGRGGAGGAGGTINGTTMTNGTAGGAGGNALTIEYAITIDNQGVLGGGGGGGGGGGASYTNTGAPKGTTIDSDGGGGGGGGRPLAVGGAGGTAINGDVNRPGTAGSTAGRYTAGAGGQGGVYINPSTGNVVYGGGTGGTGGTLGAVGGTGTAADGAFHGPNSSPGGGGAAGSCVVGGTFITWTTKGTRFGTIDVDT